jgi:hypothetical protein
MRCQTPSGVKSNPCQERTTAPTHSRGDSSRDYRLFMARAPREFVPGAVYHTFSRGSNRQAIFAFDADRQDFLMCLDRVIRIHELRCLAYCLMPNHYHLVLETPEGSV